MGYNQHQSFYLRDRWLGKALRSIEKDPSFFFKKDAFEKIGLGKNMVQSLRHWIKATNIVTENMKEKKHELTGLGNLIRRYDTTLKYQGTAAVLHYEITKQQEPSTAWYWYFNIFNENRALKEDIYQEFSSWVQAEETRVVSENSLKRDVDCLVRMYTSGEDEDDPEEVTLSPLANLNIMRSYSEVVIKEEGQFLPQDEDFLMYVLLEHCQRSGQYELSMEEIVNAPALLGRTYNLSKNYIFRILTKCSQQEMNRIVFTRTNNLDMVRVPKQDPLQFLESMYAKKEKLKGW